MNKILFVIGGGRGIGAATARMAAKRGYAVCVNYHRDRMAAEETRKSIESAGGRAITAQANIGSEEAVVRYFGMSTKTSVC